MSGKKKEPETVKEEMKAVVSGEAEQAVSAAEKPGNITFIYVGDSIPGTVLSYGRLYRGGVPAAVQGLFERYPEAAPLFIDVRDLVKFKHQAAIKGTYENMLIRKLSKRIKGEK